MRRLSAPDHRQLGTLYVVLAVLGGLAGALLSLSLRLPGGSPWPSLAAAHGIVLLVFCAIPALLGGFGNWFVPLLIGADDTASPALGATSLLLTACGLPLALSAFAGLAPSGTAATILDLAALHVTGLGLLCCAANLIATLLNLRRPGLRLADMPVFAWSQLIAAALATMAVPLLMGAVTMLALHRAPPLAQLWTPLHAMPGLLYPGTCVMLLPALGIVGEIVASVSGRPLPARRWTIAAMAMLATTAFLVWAHALLQHAPLLPAPAAFLPVALTILPILAIWGLALLQSPTPGPALLRRPPTLFALGFVLVLLAGLLARPLHDGLSLATILAVFAGFYHWIGRVTGRATPDGLARMQFWLLLAGMALCFLPIAAGAIPQAAGAALIAVSVLLFGLIAGITARRPRSLPVARGLDWSVPAAAPTRP